MFFLFLHIGCNIGIIPVGPHPVNTFRYIAGSKQHAGDNQFLDAVGIRARSIENNDALFRKLVERNVVDTSPGSGHSEEFIGKLHIVHFCAAD